MQYLQRILAIIIANFVWINVQAQQLAMPIKTAIATPSPSLQVTSTTSLIHLGSLDSFDITPGGIKAASLILNYLETKNIKSAHEAWKTYEEIIPNENFGGEYSALQWLCELFFATESDRTQMLIDPLVAKWYEHLASNDFAPLKTYLKQKYHLQEWKHLPTPKFSLEFRFLEDFILFNNPRRERWEYTSKILEALNIKPGQVIADIGSGPGYYTFKFAKLVGPTGFVYAVDTNEQHMKYVTAMKQELGLNNVQISMGLEIPNKVDLVYVCSLYHNLYGLDSIAERDAFIGGLKKMLKPNGRIVIVDNAPVDTKILPYHGPYIARDLIISQLWYHGLQLVESHQFIPQRYVLVFQLQSEGEPAAQVLPNPLPNDQVPINSKSALIRLPKNHTSPGFTWNGREAAKLLFAALTTKNHDAIKKALDAYQILIPKERFGDEYTALQFVCDYLLATPEQQQAMLANWLVHDYYHQLSANDFKFLRTYLRYKYFLDMEDKEFKLVNGELDPYTLENLQIPEKAGVTQSQVNIWGEFIAFNNPYRERWEKSNEMLEFLSIKPGDHIADVGSGAGYYTFRFSQLVGPNGKVYAVDIAQEPLDDIIKLSTQNSIANVQTILSRDNDTKLPKQDVDLVFICSMYHAMYFTAIEYVRDSFIASINRTLKPGGRLVIADNAVLDGAGELHYYGPGIAKEAIISQLQQYGFHLTKQAQFIPQRYLLVFEKM